MTAHPDILEQPERLRGAFWGSIAFHVSLGAVLVGYAWVGPGQTQRWGDPKGGGGLESVMVNPVANIPLPSRAAPTNPVANQTESAMPAPPPKPKAQTKAKAIEPKAIPIKGRDSKKRDDRTSASAPNRFTEKNPPNPGQVTSPGGPALSMPQMGMPGGGGVGVGNPSPLGTQFGWYATLLRDQVARNWKTSDIDPRLQTAPPVSVVFTLRRDGSLVPNSVKISESSGNRAIDFSAQRAILDAAPFPGLPPQYSGNEAVLELRFQLRR